MSELSERVCVPCKGGVPPLKGEEIGKLLAQLDGWEVVEEHHLVKTWKFPNFAKALDFVIVVGQLAEQQRHHPVLHFTWGWVTIELWTHKIDGLHENDFVLAAKIDDLPEE